MSAARNTRRNRRGAPSESEPTLQTVLTEIQALRKDTDRISRDLEIMSRKWYDYTHLEAVFQEQRAVQQLIRLYGLNHMPNHVKQLHITDVYLPNSKQPLTDLDGLLLLTNFPIAEMPAFPLEPTDTREVNYLFVETKHSLDKFKIDKKMVQFDMICRMLDQIPRSNTNQFRSTTAPYKAMVQQWSEEANLPIEMLGLAQQDALRVTPRPHYFLLFATDDMPPHLAEYLTMINQGMTEEEYDRMMLERVGVELKKTLEQLSHTLPFKSATAPLARTLLFGPNRTIATIRAGFHQLKDDIMLNATERSLLTPFSELEPRFERLRGAIGFLQFGRVFLPALFQKPSMNSNV
jgi:hypothetical protein